MIAGHATERGRVGVELGEQLAVGSRSAVFAWGRDAVAKVPFASTPDAWIRFEVDYTAAVHAAGAPTPPVRGVETIGGRTVGIYGRVHGRSMWEHMRERPQEITVLARLLAELQANLFQLSAPVSLPAQQDRLRCKIRTASEHVDGALAGALDRLPSSRAARLCHGDLHPGNVLMSPSGPVVIDWFDAARGDHVADIARSSLLVSARAHGPEGPSHLPGSDGGLLDLVHGAYLHAITDLAAVDSWDLRRWQAVVAVARIAEGVARDALVAIWREDEAAALTSPTR